MQLPVFGKVAEIGASQETGPWRLQPLSRPEGDEGAIMPVSSSLQFCRRNRAHFLALHRILLLASHPIRLRGSCCSCVHPRRCHRHHRGQSHRRNVVLFSNGQSSCVSRFHRRRQLSDHYRRRRPVLPRRLRQKFRQLQTPDFYAGRLDSIERNLVLEPEWVRESIVVTATGTPTPQSQTSAATTFLTSRICHCGPTW
jgi:hypothetical protein